MATSRDSNPRREGSIPSRPAPPILVMNVVSPSTNGSWHGAIVQQENAAFALQGSGCDSPSLHPRIEQ